MKKAGLMLVVLLLPFLTGCYGTNHYFSSIRNDVLLHIGGNFSEDVEFAIGPVTLSVAGWFIDSDEDPEAKELVGDLSRIQVGVYKRTGKFSQDSDYHILKAIDKRMSRFGWKYIVRSCNEEEVTAVYVNRNLEKGLRRMFVVSLDKEELTLVELQGNLSRIFEKAVQERGLSYN